MAENPHQEEFKVSGAEVINTIKQIIHEGNVRRIIVKNEKGEQVAEIPLTFGVVGIVIAPLLAALGAVLVLAVNYTILVERTDEGKTPPVP